MQTLRTAIETITWLLLFWCVARLWAVDPRVQAEALARADATIVKDRIYGVEGTTALLLDVYMPPERAARGPQLRRRPGLLAIHGGSWSGGSRSLYGPQVARLASQGYVVFVADYRLSRPAAPSWPSALEDLRQAVRWIRGHADEFGVDASRIAALGSGVGGHLALLLGTLAPGPEPEAVSSRVQAVVSLYGPTSLFALVESRRLEHEPVRQFLGRSAADWPCAPLGPHRWSTPVPARLPRCSFTVRRIAGCHFGKRRAWRRP